MIPKITLERDPGKLQKDLERYKQIALELGVTAAAVIPTGRIILDERVRLKCQFPLCEQYGSSMNCPPNVGSVAEMRARMQQYGYAIAFKIEFPSCRLVSGGGNPEENVADRQRIGKIVSAVESTAFYDGYYFAVGFGAGSCKITWCPEVPCQALRGRGCRYQSMARASMEAVGMDVYRLVTSLGWDIYPIGKSCKAEQVPHGTRVGIVLIS